MVTKVGIYVLMSLLLTLQVRYTMVQLDYLANKEYISQVLCIERDVPESSCEGKCHLKKELSKLEEQQDDKGNAPIQITVNGIDFIADFIEWDLAEIIEFHQLDKRGRYDGMLSTGESHVESPPPELLVFV